MSGQAKMRRLSTKATVWRENAQLQGNCRQRFWARRGPFTLHVMVIRTDDELSRVWARLDDPRVEDGVDVSSISYHNVAKGSLTAQIAVAQKWCENEADRLAGAR